MSSTFALIVAALLAHTPAAPAGPDKAAVAAPAFLDAARNTFPGALADLRPLEVRIRKLYLVRPDLLQFPIPYDTVC